jgi:integrase
VPKLTVKGIAALPDGLHADGGNLFLRVKNNGASRSWFFVWKEGGKRRKLGLGSAKDRTLKEARDIAATLRKALLDGKDPAAIYAEMTGKDDAGEPIPTFAEAARRVIEAKRAEWKNAKHARQWETTLRDYVLPVMGKLSPEEVTVEHVLRCLSPIWTTKPETAARVRQRIEVVLDYCAARGWRDDNNPARWRGKLEALLPNPSKVRRVEHQPALPYERAPELYAALAVRSGMAARCLRFLMLTAVRSGEARLAACDEIDLAAKRWTIPAHRMKREREHVVPLSDEACALLESTPRFVGSPYIFPSPRGGALSDMTLTQLLRRMHQESVAAGGPGWLDPTTGRVITVHGLRATFRDWAGECTHHPREVIEHALAHRLADKAEAAYQRGTLLPKRAALMHDWAHYLAQGAAGMTACES